jgi:DNA-binding MarR family transcriptional regulator
MSEHHRDSVARLLSEWKQERPDLDPSPVGIQGRIVRLSTHILRQSENWLGPFGLSWEAFSLIVTLRRSGKPFELRPTDILRESLLTSGAITNRIDRVEQMGLVERRPEEDRRSYVIRLTPAGKKLADKAIAGHFAAVDDLLSDLSSVEQTQLARLLSKLLGSMERKSRQKEGAEMKTQSGNSGRITNGEQG